ncbi:MAG TPA: vWA domain-containing protein, partial [Thermoguttaceae bacterium]
MTFTLPNWIAQWSGLETGPGEAIVISFSRGWPWPSWATLLALIFAAGIILQIYLRQGRQAGRRYRIMLAAIRFSLVAIMLLMIAQLTLSFKRTCLPDIVILVDDSKSMTIVDQYDDDTRRAIAQQIKKLTPNDVQPSRWDLARALLSQKNAALLRGLTNQYKMQLYYLTGLRSSRGPDLQGIVEELNSSKPSGETSPLGAAICHILDNSRGVEPAAIIIFSDGINTQNPSLADAAAYAQRREVPLYCIGLGSTKPAQDLKLSDLLVDDV